MVSGEYPQAALAVGGGPSIYPRLLASILFILIIYSLVDLFWQRRKRNGASSDETLLAGLDRYWFLFTAGLLLVPILLTCVGFKITGILTIIFSGTLISHKTGALSKVNLMVIVLAAFGVTLGVATFFEGYLRYPLP